MKIVQDDGLCATHAMEIGKYVIARKKNIFGVVQDGVVQDAVFVCGLFVESSLFPCQA